jgi:hypothetical protein
MKCTEAKTLFSAYLDGAVTGKQMHAIGRHLESCVGCNQHYESLRKVQRLLARVGHRKPPADLALKLRLAISHEVANSRGGYWEGVRVRLENALNAFIVPATAGLITAVVIFGVLIGFLAIPNQLQASNDDVPLMLYTAPQLQASAFTTALESINDDSLVIEAYVDSNGRVEDYRILSNPTLQTTQLLPQVKNMLIFTTFRPATAMGRPTPGRAVLSFSKINVRG